MSPADRSGALGVDSQGDRIVGLARQDDVLEVEDDVGDVLGDTGDGVELVEGLVEPDHCDRRAGHGGEQGAAERVADRVAEAGLERPDGELLTMLIVRSEGFD